MNPKTCPAFEKLLVNFVRLKNHQCCTILSEDFKFSIEKDLVFNLLFFFKIGGARLFQQYLIDMATKIDDNNSNWYRQNQRTIRRAHQQGLEDAIANGEKNAGKILPSSESGGPRDLHQRYLDSMALVTQFGKPSFFITMTCNPRWIEIERELFPNQTANDRPDIVSRVFNCKFRMFLDDLNQRGVLGRDVAHTYTIEFQKCGLPHAHLLVWVVENDAPSTVEAMNRSVFAELPDPEVNQPLAEVAQRHMIHGP